MATQRGELHRDMENLSFNALLYNKDALRKDSISNHILVRNLHHPEISSDIDKVSSSGNHNQGVARDRLKCALATTQSSLIR